MSLYHDHTKVRDEDAPDIDRIQVTRVVFRRGAGCCMESPVRRVTAYYDSEGVLIAELDPHKMVESEHETAPRGG